MLILVGSTVQCFMNDCLKKISQLFLKERVSMLRSWSALMYLVLVVCVFISIGTCSSWQSVFVLPFQTIRQYFRPSQLLARVMSAFVRNNACPGWLISLSRTKLAEKSHDCCTADKGFVMIVNHTISVSAACSVFWSVDNCCVENKALTPKAKCIKWYC